MMRRGFGVFLVGVTLFWGCNRQTEQRTVDLTVPVTVAPVEAGLIESVVTATGTLRPIREAQVITEIKGDLIFSEIDGRVATAGAAVIQGQVIARLKNQEWVVGVRSSSKKLAMNTAKKSLDEQEVLFKRGLTTEKEVANAKKIWQDAKSSDEDAGIQIDKITLRAPITGVLSEVSDITQGTLVNQNTPIVKIVDFSYVLVDLQIPNAQISKINLGQPLRVRNYAFPDQSFAGEITAINPVLDPTTRTFRAVGKVENVELLLRPGMFVQADIITESREDVPLISRKLVQRRRGQKVVFVEEEGRAQQRDVQTGLEDRENVEILSGVDIGERLITSNYETLRPRTRVRVTGQEN
ncbi:MAG: membrane fusion protein (multidrug efflux system) [Candidatus Latescibacterota bacterium]|jgi:membrane fusion protein (multidrug efflux system)